LNDRIYGNELDNNLFGDAGSDWLYGLDGIDTLVGGDGNDILRGGNARDYLFGGSGFDQLFGDAGDDYLDGGFDGVADSLNGGEGADEFVQYYRKVLTILPFSSTVITTDQLAEAELLADLNSGLGDHVVRRYIF
jgi:Ca2+-binding RTX toxin-like protein